MEKCIFCMIASGEIPCAKIYEDDNILAFMDIAPVNKGHALVITKKHFENIYDTDKISIASLASAVQKVSIAVKKGVSADGISVIQNNGKASGQEVMHIHFHIIPRFKEDELEPWPQRKYKDGEITEYSEKIRSFLP